MNGINHAVFGLFLAVAGFQDFKQKSVEFRVYILFGSLAAALFLVRAFQIGGTGPAFQNGTFSLLAKHTGSAAAGAAVGGFLLAAGRLLKGEVGEGDGWFFVVSGVYIGFKDNLELLCYGLVFCSLYCLGVLLKGAREGRRAGKDRVPFLPFLIPAAVWMVIV